MKALSAAPATLTTEKRQVDPLYSRREAAAYLGIAEQTLAVWKSTKRYALPVVKVGRSVRYRKSALDTFLTDRTIGGTEAGRGHQ